MGMPGEQRSATCKTCGRSVTETWDMALVDFADGTGGTLGVWRAERHDAPCGLPCLGGGVSMRAMRRDENGVRWVHWSGRYGCPRCAPTPPTEREE